MSFFPGMDTSEQAAKNLGGKSRLYGFGQREALTNGAVVDLWSGTADTIPRPPDAGEQMQVVSTSAADSSAGTGVRQVHIHYLNSSGVESTEIVISNGVTPVATVATDIRFVNSIHSWVVGTGGVAAGNITISKIGVPATVYNQIQAGDNMSLTCQIMVPLGKTFYMTAWDSQATDNTAVSIRLMATSHFGVLLPGIFLFQNVTFLQSSSLFNHFTVPLAFPAMTVIKVSAIAHSAGARGSASFEGWTE